MSSVFLTPASRPRKTPAMNSFDCRDDHSDFKLGQSIEWRTTFPNPACRESPVFRLYDVACYFRLVVEYGSYTVYVKQCGARVGFPPFSLRVHAEPEGRSRDTVFSCKLFSFTDVHYVWSMPQSGEKGFGPGDAVRFVFAFSSVVSPTFQHIKTDDKSCLQHLSDDLLKALDVDDRKDVVLTCGALAVGAHKVILSARSAVFAAMLNSEFVEGRTSCVDLSQMEEEVFQSFVQYLYSGSLLMLDWDTARALYETGDLYEVEGLRKVCRGFLIEHLKTENAIESLLLANAHCDDYFKDNVILFIQKNSVPLRDDLWQPFCSEHPHLANEVLNVLYRKESQRISRNFAPDVQIIS